MTTIPPKMLADYLRDHPDIQGAWTVTIGARSGRPIDTEIGSDLADKMPVKAIIVTSSPRQASMGRNHDHRAVGLDVRAYGRNINEAWVLNELIYGIMRYGGRRSMNGKQVITVRPATESVQYRDREGGWPFVLTEYLMTFSEDR